MAGPDPEPRRTLGARLTMLAIGVIVVAYVVTIVVGLASGGGR